jgi:hypothetical protein
MCTVPLPPGVNPIAVKYIISYHIISKLKEILRGCVDRIKLAQDKAKRVALCAEYSCSLKRYVTYFAM